MSTIKSSAENLTLNADGANNDIKFQSNGVEKASIDQDGNLVLSGTLTSLGIDDNADATAMTIDSSENVMVGQTSVNVGNNGHSFGSGGSYAHHTSTESTALYLNRKTSDGDILRFRKDNTNVGSISVTSSGIGIAIGGTGAANTLDDYEEGTWTPAWDSDTAGSGRVTTVNAARYTKIGNVVHISAYITLATLGTGGSGPLMITGLPFTSVAEYGSGINVHNAAGFDDVIGAMSGFRLQNADARVNITGNSTANANPYGNNLYWANYAKVGMLMMFTGTYWAQ